MGEEAQAGYLRALPSRQASARTAGGQGARHPRPHLRAQLTDLIPGFIPVLGLLDDLVLVPLGVALVIRMIPHEVWDECRAEARAVATSAGMTRVSKIR
ncbi:hypothetical protein BH24DEI2_BH24DEI2_24000 [soil metagenome]